MSDLQFVAAAVKINWQHYQDVFLTQNLLPDIRQYSDFYTFQQDEAPAQCARETVELLIRETPDVTPPSLWPPNCPDLNPVDYTVWGVLQEQVCIQEKIRTVEELQQRITEEYECVDQCVIDNAVKQWRKRLRAYVSANGGHFGHLL